MDGYTLSRNWFEFSFNNPEKIQPGHCAVYFFAIEHCNRLGWKEKFGFPSQMVMEAIGIRNWRTYQKYLNDLVEWGFIEMIEISKNQYSSNIIAIVKNTDATTKALDKALSKHSTKHGQSIASINKQETNKQETRNISKDITTEVVTYGNQDINNMQDIIKQTVLSLGLVYKPGKQERNRIQNILSGKEFGNTCNLANMNREDFVRNIIILSAKLEFWNGKIYNAETFYKHYASVYNEAKRKKQELETQKRGISV